MRSKLPDRRRHHTTEARVAGHDVFVTIGLYDDGRPGEVFLDVSKWGHTIRTWAHGTAILVSTLLQHGATVAEVVDILAGIDDPFVACVARLLEQEFCTVAAITEVPQPCSDSSSAG